MSLSEASTFLKENYYYKLRFDPKLLTKILRSFNDKKWGAFVSNRYSAEGGHGFIAKVEDDKLIINDNQLQYQMQRAKKVFKNSDFQSIVNNEQVIGILTNYFGKAPILDRRKLDIFYTKNNGAHVTPIKKQEWHIDDPTLQHKNKNYNFIKLFIPLCDVNESNGVTHVIKGSRENLPPDVPFPSGFHAVRFSDEYIYNNYSEELLVKINSKLGDVFLVRTDGFHKGGFVKSGERIMIIVSYYVK